jgi:hypothetical protein
MVKKLFAEILIQHQRHLVGQKSRIGSRRMGRDPHEKEEQLYIPGWITFRPGCPTFAEISRLPLLCGGPRHLQVTMVQKW